MNIGVIGGSGVYSLGGKSREIELKTPFGNPSGKYTEEKIGPNTVYFLPRHGVGHVLTPSEINYRANIYGFKKLGVSRLFSISAVGSMKEEIQPGDFVFPNQFIDFTKENRPRSFFGGGIVGHVPLADPVCHTLQKILFEGAKELGIRAHLGGAYICIEGPQFSTRAESQMFRSFPVEGGVSVIGMTAFPELRLAREAGICYQTVAMATDYDCWKEETESVSWDSIKRVIEKNVDSSRRLIAHLLGMTFPTCQAGCNQANKNAVVTAREKWPELQKDWLEIILS